MNIQEARTFIALYAQGKHSQKEHESFLEWVEETSMDHIQAVAADYEALHTEWSVIGKPTTQWVAQLEDRLDKLDTSSATVPLKRYNTIGARLSWAAAILIALGTGVYFLFFNKIDKPAQTAENIVNIAKKAIVPGSDKAVLTLADGSSIILNDAENGTITQQGNTTISKVENNHLVYQPIENGQQPALLYNTVITPRGGQYQLTLPDQTKIWLNAESSIRFPVAFTGKERKVEITGEVYFEVTENRSMPFKAVISTDLASGGTSRGRGEVEVVGTHFNIMAYDNEAAIQTTLLKGSVKVARGEVFRLLKPGQQARMPNNTTTVSENIKVVSLPNAEDLVLWKDGYFSGTNTNTLLQQIGRWYDVDIEYAGKIPDVQFEGRLARNAELEDVLKILEVSGIRYELAKAQRKVIIK